MPESIIIGKVDEIPPGKVKGFSKRGIRFLVANIDGAFYAIGSTCTHAGGPLEKGVLEGNVITCPWHGSRFDAATGKVVSGPASNPEPTYKVTMSGKDLIIEM
ncbi:MAG: Rieske (2Fe-2S) protein [Thaumarchaeota archaeon]|nr:Rieske (2Fe-2S) protein [Nitrososphaerota archaeon]